ncbi:hypothetical protein D3C80_2184860 [compost metagenome]
MYVKGTLTNWITTHRVVMKQLKELYLEYEFFITSSIVYLNRIFTTILNSEQSVTDKRDTTMVL